MNKLSSYVIKIAFFAMIGGVFGLWCLQLVFAYLSELQDISETYSLSQALAYVGYRSPYFLVQFTPTGVLLGAVVGLSVLAGNSEIVAIRAAGVSLKRIIGWVMLPALVFVALSLSVNEWLLPKSNQLARQIRTPSEEIVTIRGYWAVINDNQNKEVVYIDEADELGNLKGIKRFGLMDGQLVSVLSADTGTHQEGYTWQLKDSHTLQLAGSASNHTNQKLSLSLPIANSSVYLLTKDADDLSISQLIAHKSLMAHQYNRSKRHELALYHKLLSPFAVLSLLLIACSFVFGSLRLQSLGFRVVVALLTGLLFSYVQDLAGFVSLATALPPLVMVLMPIVLGAGIGMYLLAKKR